MIKVALLILIGVVIGLAIAACGVAYLIGSAMDDIDRM